MRGRDRGSQAVLVLILMLAAGFAAPAGAADPMELSDVLRLLDAGIGSDLVLMQVQRTGTRLDLGVDELIALRQAGAGEALMAALIEPDDGVAGTALTATADASVRIFLDTARDGRPAIVLTNLDENGARLDGAPLTPVRGIISSSDRSGTSAPSPAASPPAAADRPPAMEITVRREPEDGRLELLEDRLRHLETSEPPPAPVGADMPRYPINDFRDYPVLPFAYSLGYGPAIPVLAPQEFKVITYGPLPSFTSAYAVGIDPFKAVPPCTRGQACSVHQRLAHP